MTSWSITEVQKLAKVSSEMLEDLFEHTFVIHSSKLPWFTPTGRVKKRYKGIFQDYKNEKHEMLKK